MKEFLKKYAAPLISACMAGLTVLSVFLYELPGRRETGRRIPLMLSDGFLIAALLFVVAGGCMILYYLGMFDWLGFLAQRLIRGAEEFSVGKKTKKKRRRYTYFDYVSARRHEKNGYRMTLLFALGCLALSFAFLGLGYLTV